MRNRNSDGIRMLDDRSAIDALRIRVQPGTFEGRIVPDLRAGRP